MIQSIVICDNRCKTYCSESELQAFGWYVISGGGVARTPSTKDQEVLAYAAHVVKQGE